MAEKEKKISRKNSVHVVGYLKENLLELISKDGDDVIRGSLTIATDELNAHKVQFYVTKHNKTTHEENKEFNDLLELLPEKTISIASYLKSTPEATFTTAANGSSKVWVMARFNEYAYASGERETSSITLKGFKAGFKTVADNTFAPKADFEVDAFIETIDKEIVDEVETGRVLINGLLPVYDGSVMKVPFVVGEENGAAKYVYANYHVGDTVCLKGLLVSIMEKIAATEETNDDFWGDAPTPQYKTNFIRERKITGGSKTPIHDGEEGCISKKEAKDGLAARLNKMREEGKRRANKEDATEVKSVNKTSSKADETTDGFDF